MNSIYLYRFTNLLPTAYLAPTVESSVGIVHTHTNSQPKLQGSLECRRKKKTTLTKSYTQGVFWGKMRFKKIRIEPFDFGETNAGKQASFFVLVGAPFGSTLR